MKRCSAVFSLVVVAGCAVQIGLPQETSGVGTKASPDKTKVRWTGEWGRRPY
jgi:hypothetical protein